MSFMLVAAGGALGAMVRFGSNQLFKSIGYTSFPWSTLLVNVSGALLIGFMMGVVEGKEFQSRGVMLFFITGFLGSLTTFSAFSFETVQLLQQQKLLTSAANIMANMVLGLSSTYLGLLMGLRLKF